MRTIKFRMWNKYTKAMYADTGLDCLGLNRAIEEVEKAGYVLMQFTGLLDKNGKEIYEGDIVKGNAEYNIVIHGLEEGLIGISVGEYNYMKNGGKDLAYQAVADNQTAGWLCNSEVIGNIYENPELIN